MRDLPEKLPQKTNDGEQLRFRIERSLRKTCQLSIEADGTVLVKMPLLSSKEDAEEMIRKHRRWIMKRLRQNAAGKRQEQPETKLSEEEKKKLKKKAAEVISRRVGSYAERMGVDYGKISFRFQKTRWGSCTKTGNLNFNCLLLLAPEEVLDSVVVHELCHRKYMNHSRDFYNEILKVFPDYRRCHGWLKTHGNELIGKL